MHWFVRSAVVVGATVFVAVAALRLFAVPAREFTPHVPVWSQTAPIAGQDIRRFVRRAKIDHYFAPIPEIRRVLFFNAAHVVDPNTIDLVFSISNTADVLVVYRLDYRAGRLLWKMPVYTEA